MRTRLIFIAAFSLALAGSSLAGSDIDTQPSSAVGQSLGRADTSKTAQHLFGEIVIWLATNFDLPATPHGPEIKFTSQLELARMRAADRAHWQGFAQPQEIDELVRSVVAVYDMKLKTISSRMIGSENRLRINLSWFMRLSIIFRTRPN